MTRMHSERGVYLERGGATKSDAPGEQIPHFCRERTQQSERAP